MKEYDIDWTSYSNRQLIRIGEERDFAGLERADLQRLAIEFSRRLSIIQDVADRF